VHDGNQLAVLLGLMSAIGFATSDALQHRVAGAVPDRVDRLDESTARSAG
jgi:hypothetical protein